MKGERTNDLVVIAHALTLLLLLLIIRPSPLYPRPTNRSPSPPHPRSTRRLSQRESSIPRGFVRLVVMGQKMDRRPRRHRSRPRSPTRPHFQTLSPYRGTSLIRKRLPLGPYSRPTPRALRWSSGGGDSGGARRSPPSRSDLGVEGLELRVQGAELGVGGFG